MISVSLVRAISLRDRTVMDLLTKEDVEAIRRKLAEDAQLVDYHLGKKSDETLGYMGKHLTLTLNLSSGTQRRLFLKTYEVRENKEDFLGETGIFRREQDFYRIFVQDVEDCVAEPDWCARYYFSKERVLVIEDLSEKGYKMCHNRPWDLDDAHLETALRTLASMHASSLLLEREEAKSLPVMYPTIFMKEVLYDETKKEAAPRKWITWQVKDLLEAVDYLDKYSPEEKTIIKCNFEDEIMRIFPLSKQSDRYRNVLTHGDMWKNNLLFLYADGNSPKDCKFVDFQFIRYAPPAHDVMHLLCYATLKESRDRKRSHFLQLYYDSLKRRTEESGLDLESHLKLDEFLESCNEYKELALIQSLLSLHYILGLVSLTIEAETYEKYEDYLNNHRKWYIRKFFQDETYVEKVKDLFHELIDTYILKQ